MSVKVNFKYTNNSIQKRIQRSTQIAKEAVSVQVAVNSNEFIPKDLGNLEASVFAHSDYKSGLVVWNTEYAAYVYYTMALNLQKVRNPSAQHLWFEVAKNQYLSDWVNIANNVYKKNLGGK